MDNLIRGNEVSETLDALIAKRDFNTIISAVESGIPIINSHKTYKSLLSGLQ